MRKYIGIDVGKVGLDLCWLKDTNTGKKEQEVSKQTG